MSERPAIRFEAIGPANRRAVLALKVHPDQRRHVGAIGDLLADAQACSGCRALAILEQDEAIGFVRIEDDARAVTGKPCSVRSLGLRAFFIDARHQGRGLGTRALHALLGHLASLHPRAGGIALGVDPDNAPAIALYRRAGFGPLGRGYHGDASHSMRLLWRALPDPRPSCTTTSVTSSN